jgi:hypothetical protein
MTSGCIVQSNLQPPRPLVLKTNLFLGIEEYTHTVIILTGHRCDSYTVTVSGIFGKKFSQAKWHSIANLLSG